MLHSIGAQKRPSIDSHVLEVKHPLVENKATLIKQSRPILKSL